MITFEIILATELILENSGGRTSILVVFHKGSKWRWRSWLFERQSVSWTTSMRNGCRAFWRVSAPADRLPWHVSWWYMTLKNHQFMKEMAFFHQSCKIWRVLPCRQHLVYKVNKKKIVFFIFSFYIWFSLCLSFGKLAGKEFLKARILPECWL